MYSKILFFIATLYVVNASVLTINAYEDTAATNGDSKLDHIPYLMPPRCTDKICSQFCDLVGFEKGTCLNGQCKCIPKEDTSLEKEELKSEIQEYSILDNIYEKCNEICNRVCLFLHNENGTCASGLCRCSKKESSATDDTAVDKVEEGNLMNEQEGNN